MASRRRSKAVPGRTPWTPLRQYQVNPELIRVTRLAGGVPPVRVYANDIYQVSEYDSESGMTHLSIKRQDRHVVKDWRHLQAIKNEVCGPERTAIEIYPPESQLVDSANEYHLWVLPAEMELPFGFHEYLVSSDQQVAEFNHQREQGQHKGRQRPFQPGLPVAVDRNEQDGADESMMSPAYLAQPMRVKS